MKTGTIIRLSILFFLAAFVCALILKKLTTPDKEKTKSDNIKTEQTEAVDKNNLIKPDRKNYIPNDLPATTTESNQQSATDEVLDQQITTETAVENKAEVVNFSPEAANTWDETKVDEYRSKIKIALSKTKLSKDGQEDYQTLILKESELADINPLITFLLIKTTSDFNKDLVVSKKIGLFQISDEEAESISEKEKIKYLGKVTLGHPKVNTRLGLAKFHTILKLNKYDLKKALLAFSNTEKPEVFLENVKSLIASSFSENTP